MDTWTAGGETLMRRSDSLNEMPIKLTSLEQLEDIRPHPQPLTHA